MTGNEVAVVNGIDVFGYLSAQRVLDMVAFDWRTYELEWRVSLGRARHSRIMYLI